MKMTEFKVAGHPVEVHFVEEVSRIRILLEHCPERVMLEVMWNCDIANTLFTLGGMVCDRLELSPKDREQMQRKLQAVV